MIYIDGKNVNDSNLLDMYCSWRDLQERLDRVSEDSEAFILLLEDEAKLCDQICLKQPTSHLDEAIQLFVMSANCMIDIDEKFLSECICAIEAAEFVLRGKRISVVPQSNFWKDICDGLIKGDNFGLPLTT